MPVLQERTRNAIRQQFETELKSDVSIRMYTRLNSLLYIPGRECMNCESTRQLLEEVCSLSDRVDLEVIDYYGDTESALALGIDRIPAVLIGPEGKDNVRYFGMPSGFEMQMLLDTITAAATNRRRLQLETRRQLKRLKEDVHVKVFVTPGCHYCPAVAGLAHLMALESERVTADVIESRGVSEPGPRLQRHERTQDGHQRPCAVRRDSHGRGDDGAHSPGRRRRRPRRRSRPNRHPTRRLPSGRTTLPGEYQ